MNCIRGTIVVLCICVFVMFSSRDALAQIEPQFSAKMFTKQLVNPASVGEVDLTTAFANWRTQWKKVGPVTYAAYVDTPIKGVKRDHGAAFSIVSDEAGLFTNSAINLAYSHKQGLWGGQLSVGVQGSFLNMIFDGNGVEELPGSDYHKSTDYQTFASETSGVKFDMALGVHYSKDVYWFGLSCNHITNPTLELLESGYEVYCNRTLNAYAGYDFRLRSIPDLLFKASAFIKSDFAMTQFDLNCNAWYKDNVFAGVSYRFQDAVAILAGVKMKNGILLGGAYDITTSNMAYGGFGSTEIFFTYEFSLSLNSKSDKYKSVRIL